MKLILSLELYNIHLCTFYQVTRYKLLPSGGVLALGHEDLSVKIETTETETQEYPEFCD